MSLNDTEQYTAEGRQTTDIDPVGPGQSIPAWLLLAIGTYTAAYGTLAVRKHATFHSFVFDLGIMCQVLWNTAYGRLMEISLDRAESAALIGNYLGNHVRPILLLLAPVYRLYADPRLLLVLQPVVLALGAIPLFWIARRYLKSGLAVTCIVLCYLMYPALGYMNLFDFHPIIISIPLIFLAYWALISQRRFLFWFSIILALSTKEELAIPIAAFGIYCLFRQGWRRKGMALIAISLIWLCLCLMFVIPFFNEGRPYRFVSLWNHLFVDSTSPIDLITVKAENTIGASNKLSFLTHLLLPLGFLPLLEPSILAITIPSVVYLLLGNDPALHTIGYQYPAVLVPWLFLAAVMGFHKIERIFASRSTLFPKWTMVSPLIMGCIVSSVIFSPILFHWTSGAFSETDYQEDITDALGQLPPDARVATINSIGARLANRRYLICLDRYPAERIESHLKEIDYVVLDLVDCRAVKSPHQRETYSYMINSIIDTGEFGVQYWKGRILLLSRHSRQTADLINVREYVDRLEDEAVPCWP